MKPLDEDYWRTLMRPGAGALDHLDGLLAEFVSERGGWQADAACRDHPSELFFAENAATSAEAIEVCDGCAVKQECLEYALEANEKFGTWGGTTPRERRRMRREAA